MPPLPRLVLLLAVLSPHAWADQTDTRDAAHHRAHVSSQQCALGTPFNVLADSGGIWLYRDSDWPREVFFHGGELSIDHKLQQISDADAQRLREMETRTRALMPQVAGIAHDVIDLSYDALGGVIEVLTGSALNARKIERMRRGASAYVDGTLGNGRWDQQAFDGNFERYVERHAEDFKGSIARHMLWQIVTGRSEGIDKRAQQMDGQLDARLDAQASTIEANANKLCPQVEALRQLQDALAFRYQGKRLQLLAPLEQDTPHNDRAHAEPKPGNGDAPPGDAIEVQPASNR
ncbi:DUF2884 family protein [Xanthomonas sp. 3058]|uniref:DUF2884 family protein n=1 Tax=Xanthomonas sp. 3058 TaxID=3035314 RepID=UPI001616E02C|nr:DUF2884 family protein [Xanthomonas sp. 3058]MBB5862697.1 hypothetical protein [Xanthomonas sp. 3058]